MIKAQLAAQMARLAEARSPFVLATVVRARKPTSVRPGDTAVILADGTISGFVGGQCAESSVRLYSLRALETGESLLLRLVPGESVDPDSDDGIEGVIVERNPCLSGGALEIFLEPQLPTPRLLVLGASPIADALAKVGESAGYDLGPSAEGLESAAAVVVASHGHDEEQILEAALLAGVPYVGLVASRARGSAVRAALDVPPQLAAQLHTPAGLDIGASTPAEIAISILAEIVAEAHAHPSAPRSAVAVAKDPVCGMSVPITGQTLSLEAGGEHVYFCGTGCQEAYAARHASDAGPR
jgi:xanthine dehydrogenase accessory factor